MDYSLYEPEDFAADESYLRYYFKVSEEDVLFWQSWISRHPEKLDVIISADQLIALMALQLPEEEFQQELEKINLAIDVVENSRSSRHVALRRLMWAAAALLLIPGIAAILYFTFRLTGQPLFNGNQAYKMHIVEGPLKMQLEDGSIINLCEGARLTYPGRFGAGAREVLLEGEAFFDIARDADRPFYVYYGKLVTHVLGTSFSIRHNKQKKQVEVAVLSGKVEVYEQPAGKKGAGPVNNGIILTPNQKAVYTAYNRQLEALVVEKPLPLEPDSTAALVSTPGPVPEENFVFNATALPVILQAFEKIYGIEITLENERIAQCRFSGDISDMDFNARLEVICQAINATYEVRGTSILIRGQGCR